MGPVAAFSSRVETLWPFANVGQGEMGGERTQQETLSDRGGASLRGGWVVWWMGQAPQTGDGRARNRARARLNWVFPGPALGKMQSEAARLAGEPAGQREEASSEGLGGYNLLAQTDARCPAGQVMGHHLDGQPSGVGGEALRGDG